MDNVTDAPCKKVLVVQYSQTGQTSQLGQRLLAPLLGCQDIELHVENLMPLKPFPFPWPFFEFLDAFPESAHMAPIELAPLTLKGDEHFDLVILPYQVWYLAPSQPITAFLKHPTAMRVLKGTPVVTVIGCRNMWLFAQDKLKSMLSDAGARLIDNVVFTDPGPTLATFITTPRWMFTGKKTGFWGLPDAGLTKAQMQSARRFGVALRDALRQDLEKQPQPLLADLGAVQVNPRLFFSERAGTRGFHVWGKLLRAVGRPGAWQRRPVLAIWVCTLIFMILTLVPISLLVQAMLRPWMGGYLQAIKDRYELPSGSGTERIGLAEEALAPSSPMRRVP